MHRRSQAARRERGSGSSSIGISSYSEVSCVCLCVCGYVGGQKNRRHEMTVREGVKEERKAKGIRKQGWKRKKIESNQGRITEGNAQKQGKRTRKRQDICAAVTELRKRPRGSCTTRMQDIIATRCRNAPKPLEQISPKKCNTHLTPDCHPLGNVSILTSFT